MAVLAAGCGSDSSESGSSSGGGSGDSGKRPTIGSVVPTLQNPFWQRYVTFQKEAASQLGFDLTVVDGQNDGSKMLSGAQNLVAKGVDGLIYVAYFDTGKAAVRAAAKDDIPVAIADTSISGVEPQSQGFENYKIFMGPNDEDAGYQQAKALFAAAKPGAGGKINVFGLEGTLGTSVNTGRVAGLKKAVSENSDVKLVGTQTGDFLRDKALNVTTNTLQANSAINAIWSANDDMSLGAVQAVKRAGKTPGKDIAITGMDLNNDAIEAVKNGEMVMTLGGHWLQGGFLAGALYDEIKGHAIPKDKSKIGLTLLGVTKKNLDLFQKQYPNGQPASFDFKEHSQVYNKSAGPVIGQ
jgi:ABC-type sugar transport system substrate-binding protein